MIIDTIHTLLHADDTLIISTLVITADKKTRKEKLMLNNGYIKYKYIMKYLGLLISDTGRIMKDVDLFINDKRGHIYNQIYKLLYLEII